jgi:hypothetical protein
MRTCMRWLTAAILLAAMSVPIGAAAAPGGEGAADAPAGLFPPDHKLPSLDREQARQVAQSPAAAALSTARSQVGDVKLWLALDDFTQEVYVKEYTLRGIGEHIEVWVASDEDEVSTATDFPAGDCRNGVRTEITDA